MNVKAIFNGVKGRLHCYLGTVGGLIRWHSIDEETFKVNFLK